MSPRTTTAVEKSPAGEPSRPHLMAKAIDCFARHGYQGTSIDRIAREAGVTKGAIYYHFRDKEDLLFAAVTDRIGGFNRSVVGSVAPGDDAIATLRRVVDACFFHATVSNHRRFMITLMVEALDTNPRLSAEFRNVLRLMRSYVADVVRRGQEAGTFRRDVEAPRAAAAIAGAIMGAEIQHYQDPEEIDLRAVLDALVEQLVSWLAPPAGGEASAPRPAEPTGRP